MKLAKNAAINIVPLAETVFFQMSVGMFVAMNKTIIKRSIQLSDLKYNRLNRPNVHLDRPLPSACFCSNAMTGVSTSYRLVGSTLPCLNRMSCTNKRRSASLQAPLHSESND